MHTPFSLFLLSAASVSAQGFSKTLLISGSDFIKSVTFANGTFQPKGAAEIGPRKIVSWLTPDYENNLLFSNDERNPDTTTYKYDPNAGTFLAGSKIEGPGGIVHFELSPKKDGQQLLLGAGYGSNTIVVFNRTVNGTIDKIFKEIPISDKVSPAYPTKVDAGARPHQIVLDPSGQFYVVPLLGSDTLLVINAQDPKLPKVNHHPVPLGCGPRHGAFWQPVVPNEDTYLQYLLVCEQSNMIISYQVFNTNTSLHFTQAQAISTFAEGSYPVDPTKAFAAEILVAKRKDQPAMADVYVSNRFDGKTEDSIARFEMTYDAGVATLEHKQAVLTNGTVPRSMTLDDTETTLFVANMMTGKALVAFPRDPATGALDAVKRATVDRVTLGLSEEAWKGPQFVMQWAKKA